MPEYSVVGKSVPRVDGRVKATGRALFTDDLTLPGMLHGKLLRSPFAHARILNIDTSRAEELPGVKAVVTAGNYPLTKYTHWRIFPDMADASPLASDKVRFIGEEVAAVAAVDEDTAAEAIQLIKVEYEELPGVFDIDTAVMDDAPRVHDKYPRNMNLEITRNLAFGDVEQGFRESDLVRIDTFRTQTTTHAYLEPHSALASYESPGKLTIWATTGVPYYLRAEVATVLGLREADVRVIKPYVGGSFGGRNCPYSLDFCSAMLTLRTGKPVKITYDRSEEFMVGMRRHAMKMELKTGVKKDGTIVAKQVTTHMDGGAYNGFGPTNVFLAGLFHTLPYRFPHYKYEGYRVYTNKPISGPMRGFTGPQAHFAFESQLDMIAEELGIDPFDIRIKNAHRPGDVIPGLASISSCGLVETLEKLKESVNWKEKSAKNGSGKAIGIAAFGHFTGAAFNFFGTNYAFSGMDLKAYPDGTVSLFTLAPDMGQGSDTALSQIVAEELGLEMKDIRVMGTDTAIDPVDLGAYSSRITLMAGNAAIDAARDLKRQLFEAAAPILQINVVRELEARGGRIQVKGSPKHSMSFGDAVVGVLRAKGGIHVLGRGSYTPRGKGFTSPAFSFGAMAAEVEVDSETGKVRVQKVTIAHDCGFNINPMAVDGQINGSVQMGLGFALTENLTQNKGRVTNGNFLDYKMASASDMPEIALITVETIDPDCPYGAKEAGEGGIEPVAPAIANAIYNATGFRAMELPMTPDRVLESLKSTRKQAAPTSSRGKKQQTEVKNP